MPRQLFLFLTGDPAVRMMIPPMPTLNIVLVEPQIPQNTGNIARTCAATGARLHLVGPLGFSIDDKKLKRAGLDYWHLLDITYYDGLSDFFSRNQGEFFYFTTKGRHVYSEVSYPDNAYIVFGREDAGNTIFSQAFHKSFLIYKIDSDDVL